MINNYWKNDVDDDDGDDDDDDDDHLDNRNDHHNGIKRYSFRLFTIHSLREWQRCNG